MIHTSEARLRAILRASRDATVVFDREGVIRYAAPATAGFFGCAEADLPGRVLWELVHPDDLTRGLSVIARGLDARRAATVEWRMRAADGRWRWVEQSLTDLTANPAVDGVVAHLRDVSDRRELEDALHETEERFEDIFAHHPVGAALFGPDRTPVAVNASFCRMLGYEADELLGCPFAEYTHPDDLTASIRELDRLLAGEIDRFQLDKRYIRGDGSELVGRVTVWLSRDEHDQVRHLVATIEDATEQNRTVELLEDRDRQLRLVLGAAGVVAWDLDLRTGVARLDGADGALGMASESMTTTREHLEAIVHPDDRHLFVDAVSVGEGDDHADFEFECRIRTPDVTAVRRVRVRGQIVRDAAGIPDRISGITMDITERHRAEQERLEAADALRRTIDASYDAFVGIDDAGRVVEWNPAASRLFGYEPADVLGRGILDLIVPERSREALHRTMCRLTGDTGGDADPGGPRDGFGPLDLTLCHRDGENLLVEASGARVERAGSTVLHVFLRDATERNVELANLEERVLNDPLTGFPNRALLGDRLASALARLDRAPGMVATLFLDLDRFKVVNDALGHDAGDAMLTTVAARIQRVLRPQDTVARFGGDEFVVVVEDLREVDDVVALAERLIGVVGNPILVRDHEYHLGASIGISLATSATVEPASMIRDADLAMYRAKGRGGGSYELFDDDMRQAAMTRLDLEGDLHRAVEDEQLEVYYQPVVTLDGALTGVEALVRWHHPRRGLISPAEFIPVAEETGMINALGYRVLEMACTTVAGWRDRLAPELTLSVNLSVRQLADPALPDLVDDILERSGLDPDALCLELTETALMRDAVSAASTLHRLRAMGVHLAVDDFGTGYSSLLYLRRFPVEVLKLDRYFVAGLTHETEDRVIIGTIVDLASALGLVAVAEGVETEAQRVALGELGCHYAQGHLFGRPVPADSLEQLLHRRAPLLHAEPVLVPPVLPPPGDSKRPVRDRDPHRVVLVDDSPGDRSLLRAMLQDSGAFTVVGEAETAADALYEVARVQPDLVLVDLFLPGSDGLDLLEGITCVAPEARAVVVSGFVSEGVAVSASAAGAIACLDKSLSPTSMVDSLTSLLAGSRRSRQLTG